MSESYYSSYEVERKFADYEERLAKQQVKIDYLEQRFEEEEEKKEKYSDYEKREGGNCLRSKLIKKYKCDFKEALKCINYYYDEDEFNDFYFNMFTFDEIKAGYIPKEAFENASVEQIRNIFCDAIPYFGNSIVKFGWSLQKLTKKQLKCLTNDQCLQIVNLLSIYSILPEDKKKYVLQHKFNVIPKQEYNSPCLLI